MQLTEQQYDDLELIAGYLKDYSSERSINAEDCRVLSSKMQDILDDLAVERHAKHTYFIAFEIIGNGRGNSVRTFDFKIETKNDLDNLTHDIRKEVAAHYGMSSVEDAPQVIILALNPL